MPLEFLRCFQYFCHFEIKILNCLILLYVVYVLSSIIMNLHHQYSNIIPLFFLYVLLLNNGIASWFIRPRDFGGIRSLAQRQAQPSEYVWLVYIVKKLCRLLNG